MTSQMAVNAQMKFSELAAKAERAADRALEEMASSSPDKHLQQTLIGVAGVYSQLALACATLGAK
jgi:hypothetical protein